jgi:hypothetical protein
MDRDETQFESINAYHHLGIRPLCPCCGGGQHRAGFAYSKAKSKRKRAKAHREVRVDREARRTARILKESALLDGINF